MKTYKIDIDNRKFWSGNEIKELKQNEVFIMGTNPTGIHGSGAAKAGLKFGAKYGVGRGLVGQTYGLITKNLDGKAGYIEKATGIKYELEGFRSVSPEMIKNNIRELYDCARQNSDKNFLVTYKYDVWTNGTPKKSLNGYTSQEMLELFILEQDIPDNIVFHDSYKEQLKKLFKDEQKVEKDKYTFFFSLHSPFSNFHPAKFTYKEIDFCSSEQFMMFSKAKLFGSDDIAQEILNVNKENPLVKKFLNNEITRKDIVNNNELAKEWNEIQKGIKALGRKIKNYNDDIWSAKRFNIVGVGVREKFSQNQDLKEIILNTANTKFVEASKYDKVWGNGLSEQDSKRIPEEKWPGMNLLGKLLDTIRDGLKNKPKQKMRNSF